jgi:hypothetical protein
MALKGFTFDAGLREPFLALGEDLYRNDPSWIPPLRSELRYWLSPRFSFHAEPGNHHRCFLALAGDRPVARCLASVHHGLADRDGTRVGAIGFFEAEEDYAGAEAVLAAAVRWLREEHGIRRVWGPLNFDIWHGYRFMTRGFGKERFHGEPYNRAYYPELFERFGFARRQRWNTFEIGTRGLDRLLERGGARTGALLARGYRFERFDLARFDAFLARLHDVLTRSFSSFLGYTPIALPEFRRLLALARWAVHTESSTFVYDERGALAGFAGVFLDLAQAVRAMRGEVGLGAKLRFLRHRRRAKRLLLHLGGITPDEAARHSGIVPGAFHQVVGRLRAQGYETVLATLIARGNPVRRLYGEYAADDSREYTLFERTL